MRRFGHLAILGCGLALAAHTPPLLAEGASEPDGAPDDARGQSARDPAVKEPIAHQAIGRLIEVWGFVKYHHADAREGRLDPAVVLGPHLDRQRQHERKEPEKESAAHGGRALEQLEGGA